jgi:bacterioferritin (cytochrome b1)
MKGSQKVIDLLNEVLTNELTAVNQQVGLQNYLAEQIKKDE